MTRQYARLQYKDPRHEKCISLFVASLFPVSKHTHYTIGNKKVQVAISTSRFTRDTQCQEQERYSHRNIMRS